MARYELSLSPSYVKHWTFVEAIREIFQNAIDQQTVDPENRMSYEYDSSEHVLRISSLHSSLQKSSLLLGNTTKSDDKTTIGSFGEGYKLAMLVLSRDNMPMEVHNYGIKEVWIPKIVKSRRYGSDILVVDTAKRLVRSFPNNDLTFVIKNLTEDKYKRLVDNFLFLQEDVETLETPRGSVLLDKQYAGKVFCKGLYVNTLEGNIKYGYDMRVEHIVLDRDRRALDSFQLLWETSAIWSDLAKEEEERLLALSDEGCIDIRYIDKIYSSSAAELFYAAFLKKYGEHAIPVPSQEVADYTANKFELCNPVVLQENIVASIINSKRYRAHLGSFVTREDSTLFDDLTSFYRRHKPDLSIGACAELEPIIEKSKKYNK